MESGVRPYVTVTATTRDDQLSRVTMKSPILQVVTDDDPVLFWPLTDAAGSLQAVQYPDVTQPPLGVTQSAALLTFGDAGPGAGDGTGVKFTPSAQTTGQYLAGHVGAVAAGYTLEVWANAGTSLSAWASGGNEFILGVSGPFSNSARIGLASGVPFGTAGSTVTAAASIADGAWHHLVLTVTASTRNLYVDGALADTTSGLFNVGWSEADFTVGDDFGTNFPSRFTGNVGYVVVYPTVLSTTRIAAHAQATNGYSGDTTDARNARWLSRAGVAVADQVLDAGQTTVGTYPQAGKDTISASQDMATTEGGVFWFRWDGKARFASRRYRDATTPALTLDALVDLDATVYDPAYDETTLVNSSTVSRSAESGVLSTQTYTDTTSLTAFGEADADVTTYTLSDQDALNLAQSQVAGNSQPGFRLNRVAANLHASTVSKYAALGVVEIGSLSRIVNLPAGAAPLGTLDGFVEGWTEYPAPTTYRVEFDWSPVVVERMKLNDATYGKLGCDGQTLNTALTATSSPGTVIIDTAAGKPTFTTVAGEYPAKIKIGEEVITLTAAPGGSTSPQTFTGCLRGQQGTFPAAQAAGSVVTLWPRTGLAL
jgi:hypothetical protein